MTNTLKVVCEWPKHEEPRCALDQADCTWVHPAREVTTQMCPRSGRLYLMHPAREATTHKASLLLPVFSEMPYSNNTGLFGLPPYQHHFKIKYIFYTSFPLDQTPSTPSLSLRFPLSTLALSLARLSMIIMDSWVLVSCNVSEGLILPSMCQHFSC